jgi:hypothetical protein
VAVEAGLVEEVGAVVSWQLLAQVQDPYSSPEYFGDGDGDVEAFILGVSPSHVVEVCISNVCLFSMGFIVE